MGLEEGGATEVMGDSVAMMAGGRRSSRERQKRWPGGALNEGDGQKNNDSVRRGTEGEWQNKDRPLSSATRGSVLFLGLHIGTDNDDTESWRILSVHQT